MAARILRTAYRYARRNVSAIIRMMSAVSTPKAINSPMSHLDYSGFGQLVEFQNLINARLIEW
jgi:hypothetical protein